MASPDLLLVAPPTRAYSIFFSFALLYLASFIEEKGYKVEILDDRPSHSEGLDLSILQNHCIKSILDKNPRYLGFTCLTADFICIEKIAKSVRSAGFKGKIIVGGHHPTFCPQDFFVQKGIYDYVVLGEGEQTLLDLMKTLDDKGNIQHVDGIAYAEDGSFAKTSPRQLIENIDIFPNPAYHLIDLNQYLRPSVGLIRHILLCGVPILTTRGCPYQCTYCGNPSLWATQMHKKILRTRSIDKVLEELSLLKNQYAIDGFYIADDAFTLNEDRVGEFCRGLLDRRLDLVWACQTHVNLFTERMAGWMRDAGCVQVEFGVESGSDRVLKVMKKGTNTKNIQRAFDISHAHGFRTLANLMVNTPTETEEDLRSTIDFAKRLRPTIYSYAITTPLVGTEDYKKYVKPPLTREEYSLYLDGRIYRKIIDERFKLSAHRLDIGKIYRHLNRRYMFFRYYFDALLYLLTHMRFYARSVHRNDYVMAFLKRYFGVNKLMHRMNRFYHSLLGFRECYGNDPRAAKSF
ncbi:MAG: radical SAM protein [Candidatus Omnitrophota bacterium]